MKKKHVKRDPKIVSFTMSHIRGKNTGIELTLRRALTQQNFHYRCNSSAVFGHPDIVNQKLKIAIFCDSEFWHGYHFAENEKNLRTHRSYWVKKIKRNMERDLEVNEELQKEGYTVLRYWGFEIENDLDKVVADVFAHVQEKTHLLDLQRQIKVRTTLCYLERDGSYLMLFRDKKKDDPNAGKWIGVGGHIEEGEGVVACLKREIREETGLYLDSYSYQGYIDFLNDQYPPERMYLYVGTSFHGDLLNCDEGDLHWVKKEELMSLPLWEGDRAFLPYLGKYDRPFSLTLLYEGGVFKKALGPYFKRIKD